MARIKLEDAEKFSAGSNQFFQLKDDGDVESVRIMYKDIDSIDAFVVHKVKIGNSEKYVNCLRNPEDETSVCPLCASGSHPVVRFFLPLYCIKDGVIKFWERGKTIIKRLQSLCARYNPLYATVLEIERNGKAGDNQTSYSFYPVEGAENVSLDDLPEVPDLLGTYILDKSRKDLEQFLETGEMPGEMRSSTRDVEKDEPKRRERRSTPRRQAF